MVDGSYVNQNMTQYGSGGQYDENSFGYYNQDQYDGYPNQNYQSSMQIPIQQSATPNAQASSQSSGGRLLRKGIISLNRKEPSNPTLPQQQTSQINDNSALGSQPIITKPKINGPTQIPSQLSDFQVPNVKLTPSNSSYNDQNYYNDYQQQPNDQQYYEEDNYQNQVPQQQEPPEQPMTIPVKLRKTPKQTQPKAQPQPQPQPQQLPKPPKQTSYNYSYDNEDQTNITASYSNIDLFKQRQPMIESNFANSLDRSIKNFKRTFSNEFQSIIRQVKTQGPLSQRTLFDVDEYCESLKSDISSIILTSSDNASLSSTTGGNSTKSINDLDTKSTSLSRKVASTIDEYTKPFSASLAEAASRNAIAADHHISELRQLQDELESLTNIFKSTSDSIVKELQRESQNAASLRDKAQLRHSENERKLKTMRMKSTELENRTNKLASDRQTVESDIKMLGEKRSKWEQEALPLIYDEGGALRRKIMQKLAEIKSAVENEASLADVIEAVDEGVSTIKDEGEKMRNEIDELELANKAVLQRASESQILKNSISYRQMQQKSQLSQNINSTFNGFNASSIQRSPRRQSSILSEAQEKLELIKKKREEAMKVISSQIL